MKVFKYVLLTLSLVLVVLSCKKEIAEDGSQIAYIKSSSSDFSNLHLDITNKVAEVFTSSNKIDVDYEWYTTKFEKGASFERYQQMMDLRRKLVEQLNIQQKMGFFNYLDYQRTQKNISPEVSSCLAKIYTGMKSSIDRGENSEGVIFKIIDNAVDESVSTAKLTESEIKRLRICNELAKSCYTYELNHTAKGSCWLSGLVAAYGIYYFISNFDELTGAVGYAAANAAGSAVITLAFIAGTIACLFEPTPPDCHPPTGIGYEFLPGCRSVRLYAYGGSDASLTSWGVPSGATIVSNNSIEVPIISGPFNYSVKFKCKNGDDLSRSDRYDFSSLVNEPAPSFSIIDYPPNMTAGHAYRFSASTSTHGIYTLSWSLRNSSAASITQSTSYYGDFTFFYGDTYTVVATLKNTCSGAIVETTQTVVVH
jgi:hypothetical protein